MRASVRWSIACVFAGLSIGCAAHIEADVHDVAIIRVSDDPRASRALRELKPDTLVIRVQYSSDRLLETMAGRPKIQTEVVSQEFETPNLQSAPSHFVGESWYVESTAVSNRPLHRWCYVSFLYPGLVWVADSREPVSTESSSSFRLDQGDYALRCRVVVISKLIYPGKSDWFTIESGEVVRALRTFQREPDPSVIDDALRDLQE